MIKNHLTVAWRNLLRNKSQALINIGGLALGLAAFIFILQYINLERNVNRFHVNISNTYRLINEDNKGTTWPEIEPGYALKAKERCPEIKSFCRFENGIAQGIVRNVEKNLSYQEQKIGYAEGNFFEFFSFPLIAGDASSLKRSDVMFISATSAKKYFGNDYPINKTLALANQFGTKVYSIGGVFEDMGDNSDIKYDMVFSLNALDNPDVQKYIDWAALNNLESQYINTFFELEEHADYKQVEKKLIDLRNELDKDKDGIIFRLQPFSEVHMAKRSGDTYLHYAQRKYVFILGAIALLILLIAWFNYINFSTAQSLKRAGEVGVRKVIGATGRNLVAQFLWESILVNFIGFVFSISLVSMLQPLFNDLIGKQLSWHALFSDSSWLMGFGLIVLGSLVSGGYAAYVLANFNPVLTLKGKLLKGGGGTILRKVLVVSQFAISIALIIGTIGVFYQLKFMQQKDLGFSSDQLLVIQSP
ncbi:MAG: ABC transporter permease, partial [Saprospiraceae bacterium]